MSRQYGVSKSGKVSKRQRDLQLLTRGAYKTTAGILVRLDLAVCFEDLVFQSRISKDVFEFLAASSMQCTKGTAARSRHLGKGLECDAF